jgi:Flp pilus assembly pilin Flp
MNTIRRLVSDERGLETVEYAIITGLVVVGLIASISAIGVWVKSQFTTLEGEMGGGGAP